MDSQQYRLGVNKEDQKELAIKMGGGGFMKNKKGKYFKKRASFASHVAERTR